MDGRRKNYCGKCLAFKKTPPGPQGGECRLVEQALAPFARRLLEEAALLGIRDGIEATLLAAWLVRRKAAEVLTEDGEDEEAENQPGSDLDELIQELEVVRALVDQVEDIEVGSFKGHDRTETVIEAPPEPVERKRPAASAAGITLDDLERELQSAAEVLPPIQWYPEEEVREEILGRLRAGETIDIEAYRKPEPDRLAAAFSAALEVIKDGEALGRQREPFARILLVPARDSVVA